jgi:hypothetical protein
MVVAVCFMTNPKADVAAIYEETVKTTEPTTAETTAPSTEPTAPTETRLPETTPTEPATVPTEPETIPPETTKPATVPTEPPPTKPAPTEPKPTTPTKPAPKPTEPTTPTEPSVAPTEPKPEPTQPPVTKPVEPTESPENDEPEITVIAKGKHDGGPIQWKVTSDGVLTIWGNANMRGDYDYPWSAYRDQITRIVLEGGVRTVGKKAFEGMHKVTKVQLPKTVTSIGECAFEGCTSLTSLTVPYRVKNLEANIFRESAVKTVTFVGEAPASIDSHAFNGITATVYYHADYDTWITDLLQDYGGKLTWMPT